MKKKNSVKIRKTKEALLKNVQQYKYLQKRYEENVNHIEDIITNKNKQLYEKYMKKD